MLRVEGGQGAQVEQGAQGEWGRLTEGRKKRLSALGRLMGWYALREYHRASEC